MSMLPSQVFERLDTAAFKDGGRELGTPQNPNGIYLDTGDSTTLKIPNQWSIDILNADLITTSRSGDSFTVSPADGAGGGMAVIIARTPSDASVPITREFRIYLRFGEAGTPTPSVGVYSASGTDFEVDIELQSINQLEFVDYDLRGGFLYDGEELMGSGYNFMLGTLNAPAEPAIGASITGTNFIRVGAQSGVRDGATVTGFIPITVRSIPDVPEETSFSRLLTIRVRNPLPAPDPPAVNPFSLLNPGDVWEFFFDAPSVGGTISGTRSISLSSAFLYNSLTLATNHGFSFSVTPASSSLSYLNYSIGGSNNDVLVLSSLRAGSNDGDFQRTTVLNVTVSDGTHSLTRQFLIRVRNPPDPTTPSDNLRLFGDGVSVRTVQLSSLGQPWSITQFIGELRFVDPLGPPIPQLSFNHNDYNFVLTPLSSSSPNIVDVVAGANLQFSGVGTAIPSNTNSLGASARHRFALTMQRIRLNGQPYTSNIITLQVHIIVRNPTS